MDWSSIVVGAMALAGTLAGAYFSNRRASALVAYRLSELEKRVKEHNNLVERTYKLEERADLQDERFGTLRHRIESLERDGGR